MSESLNKARGWIETFDESDAYAHPRMHSAAIRGTLLSLIAAVATLEAKVAVLEAQVETREVYE